MNDECERVHSWAVYADFDGEIPNTDPIVFCASKKLAKIVVNKLNKGIIDGFVTINDDKIRGHTTPSNEADGLKIHKMKPVVTNIKNVFNDEFSAIKFSLSSKRVYFYPCKWNVTE